MLFRDLSTAFLPGLILPIHASTPPSRSQFHFMVISSTTRSEVLSLDLGSCQLQVPRYSPSLHWTLEKLLNLICLALDALSRARLCSLLPEKHIFCGCGAWAGRGWRDWSSPWNLDEVSAILTAGGVAVVAVAAFVRKAPVVGD